MSYPSMTNEEFKDRIRAVFGPAPKQDNPCLRVTTDQPTPSETIAFGPVVGPAAKWREVMGKVESMNQAPKEAA